MDRSYDSMMSDCEKKIAILNDNLNDATGLLKKMKKHLEKEKADVDKMIEMAKQYDVPDGDIIKLNVGGSHFSTMKSTLTKKIKKPDDDNNWDDDGEYYEPHLLQLLVSGIAKITYDENKDIFIDRNPHYFGYILDYLRNVGTCRPYKMPKLSTDALGEFYDEAEYYNIQGLLEIKHSQSNILTSKAFGELNELCRFFKTQEWKLIYRGSRDGFSSNYFHAKCDGHSNTLTVVKSINKCVFGGYTNAAWDQSGHYKADANAFIFSLVNKSNTPARINCVNSKYAINCVSTHGPSFGAGHGFYIASDANSNSNSNANLSGSYYQTPPNNINGTEFLTGSNCFQVEEIEVFQKA